jgi:hypothetical protein
MTEISPLRRRMVEDMTVRNLSPATQRSYLYAVAKFSRFFGKSPERLELEDVRTYQVHLASQGIAWATLNQTVAALRFFYGVTLGRPEIPERIAYAREPRRLAYVNELRVHPHFRCTRYEGKIFRVFFSFRLPRAHVGGGDQSWVGRPNRAESYGVRREDRQGVGGESPLR